MSEYSTVNSDRQKVRHISSTERDSKISWKIHTGIAGWCFGKAKRKLKQIMCLYSLALTKISYNMKGILVVW